MIPMQESWQKIQENFAKKYPNMPVHIAEAGPKAE